MINVIRCVVRRVYGACFSKNRQDVRTLTRVAQILSAPRGSADWLIRHELQYGGLVRNVPRSKVSPLDARTPESLARGGMIGGDRFLHHGYAADYERHLKPFLDQSPRTIVEVGILCGSGLAVWCDLFPSARVVGLDIDLSHYQANRENLRALGAFARNEPEGHEFDQLCPDVDAIGKLFGREGVDIVIDDGLHSDSAIRNTFGAFRGYLRRRWLYVIEDSTSAAAIIAAIAPELGIKACGELTAITPGLAIGAGKRMP